MHISICKGWNEQGKIFSCVAEEKSGGNILWLSYSREYFALDCSILERGCCCTTFRSVEQNAVGGCGVSRG